jgi:hypothetical protein
MSGPFDVTSTAKAVHATLDEAFATIPADRSHVLMVDGTWQNRDGAAVRLLYAQRVGHGWNVVLQSSLDNEHGVSGQVATIKSWA